MSTSGTFDSPWRRIVRSRAYYPTSLESPVAPSPIALTPTLRSQVLIQTVGDISAHRGGKHPEREVLSAPAEASGAGIAGPGPALATRWLHPHRPPSAGQSLARPWWLHPVRAGAATLHLDGVAAYRRRAHSLDERSWWDIASGSVAGTVSVIGGVGLWEVSRAHLRRQHTGGRSI